MQSIDLKQKFEKAMKIYRIGIGVNLLILLAFSIGLNIIVLPFGFIPSLFLYGYYVTSMQYDVEAVVKQQYSVSYKEFLSKQHSLLRSGLLLNIYLKSVEFKTLQIEDDLRGWLKGYTSRAYRMLIELGGIVMLYYILINFIMALI